MKVTLISLAENIEALGVRLLSACLKREGHEVQVLFLRTGFHEEHDESTLRQVVERTGDSGLVGISLVTMYYKRATQITHRLKKDLSAPIVWGGIHPTVRPDQCMDAADMVVIGEGEESFVELVRRTENGEDLHGLRGVWFKEGPKVVKNELAPLIASLDSLPFPDYDQDSHYILSDGRLRRMGLDLLRENLREYPFRHFLKKDHTSMFAFTTMATRGCPYECAYCFNNALNAMFPERRRIRKRSVNHLLEELRTVTRKFPSLELVIFQDDDFLIYPKEEIRQFIQGYKKDIGLPLKIIGVCPSTLNRDKLKILVDADLRFLRMGIQSGSKCTKKLYKRHHSNRQVQEAISVIHEFKDKIRFPEYDIIIDNPWETEADLIETLRLLAGLPTPFSLNLYSLVFYPGTALHEKAGKEGLLPLDPDVMYSKDMCRDFNQTHSMKWFYLLQQYALRGKTLSGMAISFLTNGTLRRYRLSSLLLILLRVRIQGFELIPRALRKLSARKEPRFVSKAEPERPLAAVR